MTIVPSSSSTASTAPSDRIRVTIANMSDGANRVKQEVAKTVGALGEIATGALTSIGNKLTGKVVAQLGSSSDFPQDYYELSKLLKKTLSDPNAIAFEDIEMMNAYIDFMNKDNCRELKQFAPWLSQKELDFFKNAQKVFKIEGTPDEFSTAFRSLLLESENARNFFKNLDALVDKVLSPSLILKSYEQLQQLQKALTQKNPKETKDLSLELEKTLGQMIAQKDFVFAKHSPTPYELQTLTTLKNKLPLLEAMDASIREQTLNAINSSLSIIEHCYEANTGFASRAEFMFKKTLNSVVEAPGKILDSAVNAVCTTDAPSQQGEGTVSQFLFYSASILKKWLSNETKEITSRELAPFSSVVCLGLKQVLSKMGDDEALRGPKQTLLDIIGRLENPVVSQNDPNAYKTLCAELNNAGNVLKSLKIYVNGFLVLGGTEEGEPVVGSAFIDNIDALKKAREPHAIPAEDNEDWVVKAKQEKNILIDNAVQFLKLKFIWEEVCKLSPVEHQSLMSQARAYAIQQGGNNPIEVKRLFKTKLKELFFAELERNRIGKIQLLKARFYNFVFDVFVKSFVAKTSNYYFDAISQYIEENKAKKFEDLRRSLTLNFTRYLTFLGEAYGNVATAPVVTGLPREMLNKELEKREANLGFKTKNLYLHLAQEIIDKASPHKFVSWILKKIIGDPEKIVRSVVDKMTGTLQDNQGYTHALNSVILDQLEEIWRLLQVELSRQQDGQPIDMDRLSGQRKEELTALVKNLFEVLNKSKCATLDELRALMKGNLLSANGNKFFDDFFMEDVIEKVTNIIAVSVQSLVEQESQLQKLTYKFANLINQAFEVGPENSLSPAALKEEERRIDRLCEQILQISVESAVEAKFDFSGRKEQQESNGYVKTLKQRFIQFFNDCSANFAALNAPGVDLASDASRIKFDVLVDRADAFQTECSNTLFEAKAKLGSYHRDQISKQYLGIATQSKSLVDAIVQMKEQSKTLESLHLIVPRLNDIVRNVNSIPLLLARAEGVTAQDFETCASDMREVETHLKELRKLRPVSSLVEQISSHFNALGQAIALYENAYKKRIFYRTLAQPGSLFLSIVEQKRQHLRAPVGTPIPLELQNGIATLKTQIYASHQDQQEAASLIEKFDAITCATSWDEAVRFYGEFRDFVTETKRQVIANCDAARQSYNSASANMTQAINASRLLDPNAAQNAKIEITNALALADQHLKGLKKWEEKHVKEDLNVNINLSGMKGLQDWATGLVYSSVKERVDGLMRLLRREETYRYGVLHHLVLIPHEQAAHATAED